MTELFKVVVPPVKMLLASRLNPAPYNPRRIKPNKLAALKASIREHGFIEPVVVQKKGSVLVGGHQRIRALTELCTEAGQKLPKVPCIVLDIDDRTAKRLNVTLNNVGGDFDAKLLGEMLREMNTDTVITIDESHGMGFGDDELTKLLAAEPPAPEAGGDLSSFATNATLSLTFDDVRVRDEVKSKLVVLTLGGKKSGNIVAALLAKS